MLGNIFAPAWLKLHLQGWPTGVSILLNRLVGAACADGGRGNGGDPRSWRDTWNLQKKGWGGWWLLTVCVVFCLFFFVVMFWPKFCIWLLSFFLEVFVVWRGVFFFWDALRVGVTRQICLQILLKRTGSRNIHVHPAPLAFYIFWTHI